MICGAKHGMAPPEGHMFLIDLFKENINNLIGLDPWYWYVASPSRFLPSLLKLWSWDQQEGQVALKRSPEFCLKLK